MRSDNPTPLGRPGEKALRRMTMGDPGDCVKTVVGKFSRGHDYPADGQQSHFPLHRIKETWTDLKRFQRQFKSENRNCVDVSSVPTCNGLRTSM